MLQDLLTWLSTALNESFGIALIAALGWGVISILLSPCHLTSIPLIVGYLSTQGEKAASRPFLLSLLFATGILISIGLIGALTASLGRMLGDVGVWGNIVVACVFFVFGLSLLELIRIPWSGIFPRAPVSSGWGGALFMGLLFGIGLGPCTFAFLAPVLGVAFSLATTSLFQAFTLVAAFGVGHCAVIAGAGGAAGVVQRYLRWTGSSNGALWLRRCAGLFVIAGGIYYVHTAF
ncbi:MAG: cytochrome C biogenesis protein [Bacteroidetes bacterium]|nr:cytochrome C biogenesis protein [Bacteroidota bacterium]